MNEMKVIIKHTVVLLGVSLLAASCEGLLDRFPLDKLSPETFLTSEAEMQTYTNKMYPIFPSGFYSGGQSDAVVGRILDDELRGARTINSGSGSWSWTQLRLINTFMEYSGNCKDEAVRNKYTGLVRFFRAYFYFEKVKSFGDVPWYDHTLGSDDADLYKARDSRELVMKNIIADIDFAIDNLPAEHSDYRVTKWTALALKSRICLFEGTYRKYHAGDATLQTLPADAKPYTYYLEQAADAADKFISSSGYSIYNAEGPDKSYIGLFTKHNISEGTNKEVILARDYSREYGVTHSANADYSSQTMGRRGITRRVIASYLMKNGDRFTDQAGWETMQFKDEVVDRDPRLAQSIRTPGYRRLGSDIICPPSLSQSTTGYCPIKYFMGKEDDEESYCDLILFRAGEVYLNYAEAKAELGDISQADIDRSIKPLRERVGMPNLNLSEVTIDNYLDQWYPKVKQINGDKAGLILEIRRERTVELLGEGLRYYDMIRWAEGKAFESSFLGMYFPGEGSYDLDGDGNPDVTLYSGDSAPDGHASSTFKIGSEILLSEGTSGCVDYYKNARPGYKWNEERDYLLPIPVKERSLTEGVLTQNPGWDDGLSF